MRRAFLAAGLLALLLGGPAAGAAPVPVAAKAKLSSALPGARAALTIRFRSLLECGRLKTATLRVRLPNEMHVPARIPRTAVLVSAQVPAAVHVKGHAITLSLPQAGITCMTMGFGTVTVEIRRAAGLRNPTTKGSYDFTVVAGGGVLLGTFAIT